MKEIESRAEVRCAAAILVSTWLLLGAPFTSAGKRRTGCSSSTDAAVQCFVQNAVQTGLSTVPAGMSMNDYKAYGVSVSNIVQSPPTLVFVLGTMSAISDAMPPTDSNGATANQAAQDAAVNSILDAALRNGLIVLPQQTTAEQLKLFAREVSSSLGQNNGVNLAPGAVLRLLDGFLLSATDVSGAVNWGLVQSNISNLVDNLVASGLLKLPIGLSASVMKQFAYEVTQAIQNYKTATGRTRL